MSAEPEGGAPVPLVLTARGDLIAEVMMRDGCGGTVDGRRVFCNDPAVDETIRHVECVCRSQAALIDKALAEAGDVVRPSDTIFVLEILADHGVSVDVQDVLVYGSPVLGVPAGSLRILIDAVLDAAARGEGAPPLEHALVLLRQRGVSEASLRPLVESASTEGPGVEPLRSAIVQLHDRAMRRSD